MPVFEPFENAFTTLAQDLACGLGQGTGTPIEQGLDPSKALVGSGTEPAEGADTTKAFGQDVLEEATDKFDPGQSESSFLASVTVRVLDRHDLPVIGKDGVLAHGRATDIAREVVDDVFASADGLAEGIPILPPDAARDGLVKGGIGLLHRLLHEGAHLDRQVFDGEKVIGILSAYPGTVGGEAALRDDVVNVRVVFELACPGVKDAEEP